MWPLSNASSKRVEPLRLPIIVGIWPFESALNAEFMANEVPGVTVPDALVERMRQHDERRGGGRGRRASSAGNSDGHQGDGRRRADLDAIGPVGRRP